jgi:hypothetical protein
LDAFRQELPLCRQRLLQFTHLFRATLLNELSLNTPAPNLSKLGGGSDVPHGAEVGGCDNLPPELVLRFDRSFQYEVLERQGGMWGLFSRYPDPSLYADDSPRPTLETLAEDLRVRARCAIQATIKDLNVAQMFLQTNGGPETALPVLLAHAEAARSRLRAASTSEHLVLALPTGPAGDTMREMLATALPGVPTTVVPTTDEVILSYEAGGWLVQEIARALVGAAEVPTEVVRRVMTRRDVSWTVPDPDPV